MQLQKSQFQKEDFLINQSHGDQRKSLISEEIILIIKECRKEITLMLLIYNV